MTRKISPQETLFDKYIDGTPYKGKIKLVTVEIGNLSAEICRRLKDNHTLIDSRVFVNTKVLKHIYDDHEPQRREIIKNLDSIIRLPDAIYENNPDKSGDYIFVKELKDKTYCAILDITEYEKTPRIELRTCFYSSRPKRYLKESKQVWNSKE